MSATQQQPFVIQRLDDQPAVHISWGSWLDARAIRAGTEALMDTLQQQPETRFVLFDMTHTQHFSLQHMALNAVDFYEDAPHYHWLLIGSYQQVRPCEAILQSLFDEMHTQHFKSKAEALTHLQAHYNAAH
jgi:hypothetical protein